MAIFLILVMIFDGRNCFEEWNKSFNPCFVSKWHPMEAQTESSFIEISHYLNETPIKVVADVKVKDGEQEYIFRGMGGAERDDDQKNPYGGVLVLYNEHKVMLIAPKKDNTGENGEVIYTGSKSAWQGPNDKRRYRKAEVRIRVWKLSDFPEPFLSNWTLVQTTRGKQQSIYNEIRHSLNGYPDFVNLQVKVNLKDGAFIFEGQGSSSVLYESQDLDSGGAVYGYSDINIRIWFKNSKIQNGDLVFSAYDGWGGKSYRAKTGQFRVIAWKFSDERINATKLPSYRTELYQKCEIDSTLVNAQFQVLEGRHIGYRFYGVGSTMNDGPLPYGGMIYAVSNSSVLVWIPKTTSTGTNGSIFNLDGMWGNSTSHQKTNNVLFRIEVVNWINNGIRCPVTNIAVDGASMVITGNRLNDTLHYKCQEQHWYVTGNLTRTCQDGNTWSGQAPVCTKIKCPMSDVGVSNAKHSIIKDSYGISLKYQCDFGYSVSEGNLKRTCQLNNAWSGKQPVCTLVKCPTENLNDSASTTLLNKTGDRYMDRATYKCSTYHRYIGGENYRICQISSTWSDLTMNCYRCRCRCINESDARIAELMSQTKQQLAVKKETLSTFIRKRTSVKDNRPTAKGIGIFGSIMLTLTVICIIVPDLPLLRRHIVTGWKNIRSRVLKRNISNKNC